MIQTGLLSVTFRQLSPLEIIQLVAQVGLQAIEWGGDIHVPHGDVNRAKEVKGWTESEGIAIASYGSYYRVGCTNKEGLTFDQVLESAVALQAPAIRVWAGDQGSDISDDAWWDKVITDAARIADLAQGAGITVDFEYHGNTLTDTRETTVRLLEGIGHSNIRCNWQPSVALTIEQRQRDLRAVLPWLANVHVFQWEPGVRKPLADGLEEWRDYVSIVREAPGHRYAMLEFVRDNDPQQFLADAVVLKQVITDSLSN
ncbi:sugar phosphate isomerase/epimerase [Paenibacillus sp. WQ 127069]|uniref:Sugar phosphate isomerase/epimerase n=1 Tax=Paenibacillus baimaensis TaxID=2982185 RepID=A0ABT2UNK6_9BACL|nr:sugar phosphate isomerase/epimerase [Paenibacillus sp. WQ 127069]MCU6796233.1 sugar phosphate isomerase/epimerase [Paenibacillus sp. WQ 127069]